MSYQHEEALKLYHQFLKSFSNQITPNINKACEFALQAHYGQVRKSQDIPYVFHLFDVAGILIENDASEELIIAGLLHDVIEDTDKNEEDIKSLFEQSQAEAIIEIIMADNESDKSASWEARKQETIDYLNSSALDEGIMLIYADKMSNLGAICDTYAEQGDKVWSFFKRGKDKQVWYYQEIYLALCKKMASKPSLLNEYKQLLDKIC